MGGSWGGVWYRGGYTGWVYGRVIPVPSQLPARRSDIQRSGPVGPAGAGVVGYLTGCARAPGPPTPLRYGARFAVQDLSPSKAASGPIRRELVNISIKLVKTAECHQNIRKRPVIVPIFKTGSESHLLKFLEFCFRQPSLTRN